MDEQGRVKGCQQASRSISGRFWTLTNVGWHQASGPVRGQILQAPGCKALICLMPICEGPFYVVRSWMVRLSTARN